MSDPSPEIIPDKMWLNHMVVIIRQTEKQTGLNFTSFLDSLEEDFEAEPYDDQSLVKAIQSYMKKHYPDEPRKTLN